MTVQAQGLNAIADNIGVAICLVEGEDEVVSQGKPTELAKNAEYSSKQMLHPYNNIEIFPNV